MKKGIQIGLIWAVAFLLLFPVGNVMAVDVQSANDTSTTISCVVQTGSPVINDVKFMDSSWTLRNNTQIDVLQTYYFVVDVTQDAGWVNITYVNITLSFDFGDDSDIKPYVGTNNTQFRLVYENTTGTASFGLASAGNGEVTFVAGTETYVNDTTRILNFSFTPQNEIRHATGAGTGGLGFNDLYSWNYRVNATNNDGLVSSNWDDEFGVYRYTSISASGDPTGSGNPGQTVTLSPSTTVTFSANEEFNLSVSISDLTSGTNTIAATNVEVLGGNIAAYTAFGGAGVVQWIYGGAGSWQAPYDTYNPSLDHQVQTDWRVNIPFGTPTGTYSSPVTYTIEVN